MFISPPGIHMPETLLRPNFRNFRTNDKPRCQIERKALISNFFFTSYINEYFISLTESH